MTVEIIKTAEGLELVSKADYDKLAARLEMIKALMAVAKEANEHAKLGVSALAEERAKLAAECAYLKKVIHPIANEHTDCECTDRPVWYVVNPRQMMRPSASEVCHMFHGPFWSRERAEEFMSSTRYRYRDNASVFCKSLYHYPEMRGLYDASKAMKTPAADAAIAEFKAQGVDEFAKYCWSMEHTRSDRCWVGAARNAELFAENLRAGVKP